MDSILLVRDYIPIPCHSHIPDYRPYINDYNFYVEQLMEIVTALSFMSHNTFVLATQTHETIVITITYHVPLCYRRHR